MAAAACARTLAAAHWLAAEHNQTDCCLQARAHLRLRRANGLTHRRWSVHTHRLARYLLAQQHGCHLRTTNSAELPAATAEAAAEPSALSSGPFASALGWDIWGTALNKPQADAAPPAALHDVRLRDLTPPQRAFAERQNWICPLTGELMRDPVYSTAWAVYEREALLMQQRMGHLSERLSCTHTIMRKDICKHLKQWGLFGGEGR